MKHLVMYIADWQPHNSWEDKRAEKQKGGLATRAVSKLEKGTPASKLLKSSPETTAQKGMN